MSENRKEPINPVDGETGPAQRPKIGLALGGGAARGWAHIGALRALLRYGYEPDLVVGTSVGALVGGCYLAGALDPLEAWARSLTKRRMISYFDVMLNGSGIISGGRLEKVMRRYLEGKRIETLPKPFIAVATELATGHEYWMRDGDLIDSLQASFALPGVFAPKKRQDRWLIDGALVNPLPVSVCRALGARLVIAVGCHAGAFGQAAVRRRERFGEIEFLEGQELSEASAPGPHRLIMKQIFGVNSRSPGIGAVMLASFNIIMDRLTRARLAGDPADVTVLPNIGHVGLLDFDKADELIRAGEAAVEAELPKLEEAMMILS